MVWRFITHSAFDLYLYKLNYDGFRKSWIVFRRRPLQCSRKRIRWHGIYYHYLAPSQSETGREEIGQGKNKNRAIFIHISLLVGCRCTLPSIRGMLKEQQKKKKKNKKMKRPFLTCTVSVSRLFPLSQTVLISTIHRLWTGSPRGVMSLWLEDGAHTSSITIKVKSIHYRYSC